MAPDLQQERQQAHALLDLLDEEDEELTEEDRRALRASDEYFRKGGQGIPFEQVVDDLGFTMEQIRGAHPKE